MCFKLKDADSNAYEFQIPFHKLEGVAAPTANDDADDNFFYGSVWVNKTDDTVYICANPEPTAAVWVQVGSSGTDPEFTTIELGHASDTTLARSSAGNVTIEGNLIYRAGGTDVPVADGGSGRSDATAYAVICGGTTSTAAHQSVASVGTSGQVLTSNGAGALPTFQDASTSVAAPLTLTESDGDTTSVSYPLILAHATSGTAAAGFGTGISFTAEDAGGFQNAIGSLDFAWEDATNTSEDAYFVVNLTYNGGTGHERFRVSNGGQISWKNNSNFNGILSQANTANRTYTFPNETGTVSLIATAETLTNKTLTTPTIANFTNATHDHSNAAGGGTLATTAYPTFVQAGGSAAKGAVPSPGATAHTNQPYFLADDGTWKIRTGAPLGYNYTTTQESTTSTSYVDLTTTQHVSFTLDAASDVWIEVSCAYLNTGGAFVGAVAVDMDGSDTLTAQNTPSGTSVAVGIAGAIKYSLASGAHTAKMQYLVAAGTGFFSQRGILITKVS
jgi:hypothetical protein